MTEMGMRAAAARRSAGGSWKGGSEGLGGPAGTEFEVWVLSSEIACGICERNASLFEAIGGDERNVSWCVTQLIVGFCWCNHEYPRTAAVDRSSVVIRNRMVCCEEYGNSTSRSVH